LLTVENTVARRLETAIFLTLTAIVALRPLIGETYDYHSDAISLALADIGDPTPIRTLLIDSVILLCGIGCLIARAVAPRSVYRRTGLEWGSALLVVAAVVSCATAGQKRLAMTASLDWLCHLVLAIALTQLLWSRVRRRVLLAAVIASATVQTVHCYEQYFVGFDETWATYQAERESFWAKQGVPLDSNRVELFERRMLAREMSGTFYHSNVAGSYLVLCGLAALSWAIASWKHRRLTDSPWADLARFGSTLCAALMLIAGYLTGSLGAWATGGAGLVCLLLVWGFRDWVGRNRGRLFWAGWATFAVAMLAVVGHGLAHGSLPGSSLNFRWHYWVNSSRMIADHPLTGVGRENFGRHYVFYKPIDSPEEIANPHNLFVQGAAEWGLPGLAGMLVLIFGTSRVLAGVPRTLGSNRDNRAAPGAHASNGRAPSAATFVPLLLLGIVVVAGRLALAGSAQVAYLFYTGTVTALAWLVGAACVGGTGPFEEDAPQCDHLALVGCFVGVLAFAMHELVNFALFVPGSAITLFALLALCCAHRDVVATGAKRLTRQRRWLPPVLGSMVLAVVVIIAVLPPVRAARWLRLAESTAGQLAPKSLESQPSNQLFEKAISADPLDSRACEQQINWLRSVASIPQWQAQALQAAEASIRVAIDRDPHSVAWRRRQMHFYLERGRQTGASADFTGAAQAAEAALALYPEHPRGLVALGDCQLAEGEATQNRALLEEAVTSYQRALALDGKRLSWETLQRFTEAEQAGIRTRIDQARR